MTLQRTFLPAFLLCFFTIISCKENSHTQDCDKYRNGEFFIKATRKTPLYIIRRKDSLQYEINDETKSTRIYCVKWLDACTYELELLHKPTDSVTLNQGALRDSLEKITSTITIVKGEPGYYIFSAKKKGISFEFQDTLWTDKPVGSVISVGEKFK